MRVKIVSVGLLILLIAMTSSCTRNKTEWKGIIEEIDGVTIVKNPKEPLYGEFVFDLEEDLSIGGNVNDDNYYFMARIRKLVVDDQLNIFVIDRRNRRIQKYDRAGNYLVTFGRFGQGPGEFQIPNEIIVDNRGKIWVFDLAKRAFVVFSENSVYEKNIPVETAIFNTFFSKNGFVFFQLNDYRGGDGPQTTVLKFNPDTLEKDTIAKFIWEKKGNYPGFIAHNYSYQLFFHQINQSFLCYGFSSEYKIHIIDGVGNIVRIIEKYEEPIPISREEKGMTVKEGAFIATGRADSNNINHYEFPSHRPFFRGILTDIMGRIYVLRFQSILNKEEKVAFDVFGKDGSYLYQIVLPFIPVAIKSGYLFEIRTDAETGEITIVRHIIKNWDQIKSGI